MTTKRATSTTPLVLPWHPPKVRRSPPKVAVWHFAVYLLYYVRYVLCTYGILVVSYTVFPMCAILLCAVRHDVFYMPYGMPFASCYTRTVYEYRFNMYCAKYCFTMYRTYRTQRRIVLPALRYAVYCSYGGTMLCVVPRVVPPYDFQVRLARCIDRAEKKSPWT